MDVGKIIVQQIRAFDPLAFPSWRARDFVLVDAGSHAESISAKCDWEKFGIRKTNFAPEAEHAGGVIFSIANMPACRMGAVHVFLNYSDEYDVLVTKPLREVGEKSAEVVAQAAGVYCDMLPAIIDDMLKGVICYSELEAD